MEATRGVANVAQTRAMESVRIHAVRRAIGRSRRVRTSAKSCGCPVECGPSVIAPDEQR